jgi:hypothetical protein
MRTIIAGSRGCTDYYTLLIALGKCGWTPTVVISGTARGADQLGEQWAKEHNVPLELFPADWEKHGKAAGYLRNVKMAEHAEALLAIWDGTSKGTRHMIDIANKQGLRMYVHKV